MNELASLMVAGHGENTVSSLPVLHKSFCTEHNHSFCDLKVMGNEGKKKQGERKQLVIRKARKGRAVVRDLSHS